MHGQNHIKYEVRYVSVCPLLGALCQYPEMLTTAILHLHISVDLST
jgi:hypothetical protein